MRISWTISWYIFKDLLKIFMMTSGALAGIMSFGGLLRPLTQQGLDAAQISQLLTYFSPAMTAYSLPIAALFAATVVYGRLSADNELTACRASGISHGAVALPALALGLMVALISLMLLSFVVPNATLKVEKVIYSNIAKLISNRIDRTHQIKFGSATVFAQQAYLPVLKVEGTATGGSTTTLSDTSRAEDADGHFVGYTLTINGGNGSGQKSKVVRYEGTSRTLLLDPPLKNAPSAGSTYTLELEGEQQVVLVGPTIVTYERPKGEADWYYKVPVEFWTAGEARVFISRAQEDADNIEVTISLLNGAKFPRDFKGGLHASVAATHFGPIEVSSPIKENVKFMDLWQLKHLYNHQHESRRISRLQEEFIDRYQKYNFVWPARDSLNNQANKNEVRFQTLGGERYILERGPKEAFEQDGQLVVGAARSELSKTGDTIRVKGPGAPDPTRTVKLWHLVNNDVESVIEAYDARVRARPRRDLDRIDVTIELHDAVLPTPEGPVTRGTVTQTFAVPFPNKIRQLEKLPLSWFVSKDAAPYGYQIPLRRELIILSNDIWSEMNSRVSFSLSCLILVMVGAALGMMFRSGNFLTAFAVSFVPALLSITLIIAGQRVCGNVGWKLDDPSFRNPLPMGIALIWAGNVANFIIATVLLGRLWRT